MSVSDSRIGPADSPELVRWCQVSWQWWKWIDFSWG